MVKATEKKSHSPRQRNFTIGTERPKIYLPKKARKSVIIIITIVIAYSPYRAHARSPPPLSRPTAYTARAQTGPAICDTQRVIMTIPSRKRFRAWESET